MSNNKETRFEAVKQLLTVTILFCFYLFVIDEFKLIHQIIFNRF
jgi:hypothetical protein